MELSAGSFHKCLPKPELGQEKPGAGTQPGIPMGWQGSAARPVLALVGSCTPELQDGAQAS